MADLADQLGWCITSKDHLQDLSYAITSAENNINNTMMMLQEYSFSECNQQLLPIKEKFHKGANETQKFIAEWHIKYLEDRSKTIADTLRSWGIIPQDNDDDD